MKYNKDLYSESEKLCLEGRKYILQVQEKAVLSLIKEMLNDVIKCYYSDGNKCCLVSVFDFEPNGNNNYYNLIASIIEFNSKNYFKNTYAFNISQLGCRNDNNLRYIVEWDYETYYQHLQHERKVKEKGKLN